MFINVLSIPWWINDFKVCELSALKYWQNYNLLIKTALNEGTAISANRDSKSPALDWVSTQ